MSNPITMNTALEILCHEAVVREAYKDSVGVWTWSVGLTSATGHSVERYKNNPQTMEHCLAIFVWALNNYADDVRSKFKEVTLTEAQFAGALSFHWNTGRIRNAEWVNSFIKGNHELAAKQIMSFNKPPEIVPRREAERDLIFSGKWSNDGMATEWTTVRANGSIDWSKSRRFDARPILGKLLGKPVEQTPVVPVTPDNVALLRKLIGDMAQVVERM